MIVIVYGRISEWFQMGEHISNMTEFKNGL